MSYNEGTSKKYGWEPSWFGADDFGSELGQKVIEFQKELGITADGLVGPSTYRRIFAHREANIDDYEPAGENTGTTLADRQEMLVCSLITGMYVSARSHVPVS